MHNNKTILLIEDDMVDAMTVRRAFKELRLPNPLHHVENGEAALEWLHDSANSPCLMLLDLNMPRMNGLELLQEVKADQFLRRVPIVILTTSEEDRDRTQCFDFGVAGYMIKPVDYSQFLEMMQAINTYWSLSKLAFPECSHE
jgi:CheY-like chemotaxis protein